MQINNQNNKTIRIFTKRYWQEAANQLGDIRMLTIAALIVALRIIVKLPILRIQLADGLSITLDAYVNSLGSLIYGPVVAIFVGVVSDTLGVITTGSTWFPLFILTEVSSSVIFALFFWRKPIKLTTILSAKFTVNLVCNIIMTSLFQKCEKFVLGGLSTVSIFSIFDKWDLFVESGVRHAQAYNIINGIRIVKNLVLFPLEAMIIVIVLSAALPVVSKLKLIDKNLCYIEKPSTTKLILQVILFTAISIVLVLLYVFFLKDFVANLNIKFW